MRTTRVIIDGKVFWIREGELAQDALLSVSVNKEFGFSISGANLVFNYRLLQDALPDVLTRVPGDRIPVHISMTLDDSVESYEGFLEDNVGQQRNRATRPDTVAITSRGILALLVDDLGPEKRVTVTKLDADWGEIVAIAAKARGFLTNKIQSTGMKAGELTETGYLYTRDNVIPSELVTDAMGATGFIAYPAERKTLVFAPPKPDRDHYLVELIDSDSMSWDLDFAQGRISKFSSARHTVRMDPGTALRIIRAGDNGRLDEQLSGYYYVVQSNYSMQVRQLEREGGSARAEFLVARELPVLKK